MELLDLELTADKTHEKFGARVSTKCGGVALVQFPVDGAVYSPTYARAIAAALVRGADLIERSEKT